MPIRILCAGDIHIGRRPTRLPDSAEERRHSAASIWTAIVDLAISERVDAVVLTGDVVDQENKYLEAYGPLEAGVRRLVGAGVDVLAVAGNHDFDVLPRLVRTVGGERFHLLGSGGRWERFSLVRGGSAILQVDGWSFPRESVRASPLAAYDLPHGASVPTLGLLHADLDQVGSRYAPVQLAELVARPVAGWLLGHVHEPRIVQRAGSPLVLYPGSPQPLDPGETGAHGAWILEVGEGPIRASFRPIATVRYERIPVALGRVGPAGTGAGGTGAPEDLEGLAERVASTLRDRAEAVAAEDAAEDGRLEWLAARLRLEGRTRLAASAGPHIEARAGDLRVRAGSLTAFVEKVESATLPEVSLDGLSRGRDAAATLARVLIDLERGGDPGAPPGACGVGTVGEDTVEIVGDLVREAERRLASVVRAPWYQRLAAHGRGPTAPAREILLRQGSLLLDALLAQKDSGHREPSGQGKPSGPAAGGTAPEPAEREGGA